MVKVDVEVSVWPLTPIFPQRLFRLLFCRLRRVVIDEIHVNRLAAKGFYQDLAPDLDGQLGEEGAVCGGGIGGGDEALGRGSGSETPSALSGQLWVRRDWGSFY
jgi:hypothetical protein